MKATQPRAQAQHTPGPWKFSEQNGTIHSATTNICTLTFRRELLPQPAKTNGHLMAAAPELLRALRDLRQNVHKDMRGYWTESTANLMQQADVAIAKATGGK